MNAARTLLKNDERVRDGDVIHMMMALSAGKLDSSPFGEEMVSEMRLKIADIVGVPEEKRGTSEGQNFRLGILSMLLEKLGDPDWRFVEEVAEGVPIGVDYVFPRTPAVFEEKLSWKLDGTDVAPELEVPNYVSTVGYEKEVRALFEEEAALGWMKEYTNVEAEREFGD